MTEKTNHDKPEAENEKVDVEQEKLIAEIPSWVETAKKTEGSTLDHRRIGLIAFVVIVLVLMVIGPKVAEVALQGNTTTTTPTVGNAMQRGEAMDKLTLYRQWLNGDSTVEAEAREVEKSLKEESLGPEYTRWYLQDSDGACWFLEKTENTFNGPIQTSDDACV